MSQVSFKALRNSLGAKLCSRPTSWKTGKFRRAGRDVSSCWGHREQHIFVLKRCARVIHRRKPCQACILTSRQLGLHGKKEMFEIQEQQKGDDSSKFMLGPRKRGGRRQGRLNAAFLGSKKLRPLLEERDGAGLWSVRIWGLLQRR